LFSVSRGPSNAHMSSIDEAPIQEEEVCFHFINILECICAFECLYFFMFHQNFFRKRIMRFVPVVYYF
jgi:hypothetical protein